MATTNGESSGHGAIEQIDFVTLGMFIIDDIYPPPSAPDQTPRKDVIGGAGTYSAIGARLFSPPPQLSKTVGWIVDAGTDFPPHVRGTLESWQTSALFRPRQGLTTRGWNGYGENEHRAFNYLTPKLRLTPDDLTPPLLRSASFHLICSPTRCMDMVARILYRRAQTFGTDLERPRIIWEPVPDLCKPEELDNTFQALQSVDVVSPNHEELGSLFSFNHYPLGVDKIAVEDQAAKLLASGVGFSSAGAVVVRAGKDGCYICSPKLKHWLPAYHTNPQKVVDPTGGGNAFLGGFAVEYIRTNGNLLEAARAGSVAASFAIEQVGVPVRTTEVLEIPTGPEEAEKWNGLTVFERLWMFRERTMSEEEKARWDRG